jgi:hypothetical protein
MIFDLLKSIIQFARVCGFVRVLPVLPSAEGGFFAPSAHGLYLLGKLPQQISTFVLYSAT